MLQSAGGASKGGFHSGSSKKWLGTLEPLTEFETAIAMQNNAFATGAGLISILTIALIACAIMLLPMIFYLLTLQKAFSRCSPENRAMAPGMVWLMLIPLFNLVWHFIVVTNLSKTLGTEFQRRGITEE